MNAAAIIVGAGLGERLGCDTPKALVEIAGKPMIYHSAATFSSLDFIKYLIIAAPAGYENEYHLILQNIKKPLRIITGGATRTESVMNCFAALSDDCDIVGIHDSARPLIEPGDICNAFETAEFYGSAVLAVPVSDTLKITDDTWIIGTQSRENLWAVQTPQVFKRDILEKALNSLPKGVSLTDDCSAIELIGEKIKIVPGKRTNIKITYPEDLAIAECLLRAICR